MMGTSSPMMVVQNVNSLAHHFALCAFREFASHANQVGFLAAINPAIHFVGMD